MACNLKTNVGYGTNACVENFSGVGGDAFIFMKEDLDITSGLPAYSEEENRNGKQ